MKTTENLYLRNGTFWIRYNCGGRKIRRSLGTDSLREAQRLKREILGAREVGDQIRAKFGLASAPTAGAPVPTFAEVAESWKLSRKLRWRARSLERMSQILDGHLLPFFGTSRIGDIIRDDVRRFLAQLAARKNNRGEVFKRDTKANIYRCLRRVFRYAYREGMLVGPDPTDLAVEERPTPNPRGRSVFLTEEEVSRLLGALQTNQNAFGRRLYVMATTAVYAGLRWGEINGLRWQDLDLDAGTPTIRIQMSDTGEAKTEGSKALRALHPLLVRVLKQWRDAHGEFGEYVFPGKGGKPRAQAANDDRRLGFEPAAKAAGISKHVTPHVLRHTYGTLTYIATRDLEATRRLLRHSSINTTMKYVHDVRDLGEHIAALPDMLPRPVLKAVP